MSEVESHHRILSAFEEITVKDAVNDCCGISSYLYLIETPRTQNPQIIELIQRMSCIKCMTFQERAEAHSISIPEQLPEAEVTGIEIYNQHISAINCILQKLHTFTQSVGRCTTKAVAKQLRLKIDQTMFLIELKTAVANFHTFIKEIQQKVRAIDLHEDINGVTIIDEPTIKDQEAA